MIKKKVFFLAIIVFTLLGSLGPIDAHEITSDGALALRGGAHRNMNINRGSLDHSTFNRGILNRTGVNPGAYGAYGRGDVPINTYNNGVPVYNPYVYSTPNPYVVYPYPFTTTVVTTPQATTPSK